MPNNKNNKNSKKQNLPYYMNYEGKVEKKPDNINLNLPEIPKKFSLLLPNHHENVYITIDNIQHNFTPIQYDAFVKGCLNIYLKINPEIDLMSLINNIKNIQLKE